MISYASKLHQKRFLLIIVAFALVSLYILSYQTSFGSEKHAPSVQILENDTVDDISTNNTILTKSSKTKLNTPKPLSKTAKPLAKNGVNNNSKNNINRKSTNKNPVLDIKSCFSPTSTAPNHDIVLFEDIFEAKKKPTPNRSIFFIETTCVRNGLANLNPRQACAVESAARWNPKRDIFVLFVSQVGFSENLSSPIMKSLRLYNNVYFRRINYLEYSTGTPAHEFFVTDKIFKSFFLIETFSDVLRLITLYRFGGIYLDSDTVVQKNLDVLPPTFAGREVGKFIANGVMGFSHDGPGHEIAGTIIKDVSDNFDPFKWGNTGPRAITQTLERICNKTAMVTGELKREHMTPENCMGFHVLPEATFYPIYGTKWERFFDANCTKESLRVSKESVLVHFWNKLSSGQPILKDFKNQTLVKKYKNRLTKNAKIINPIGETAYGAIAEKNCPRVYASSGDLF